MEMGLLFGGAKYCTANWAVLERKYHITFVYQEVSSRTVHPGAGIGRFLSVKLAVDRAPADSPVNSRCRIAPLGLFRLLSRILKLDMRVRVLFFGVLKDVFQRSEDSLELGSEATVSNLLEHYRRLVPERAGIFHSVALAVNQEYATAARRLEEGDEVAVLPPVSGGLEMAVRPESYKCEIVRERIATEQILEGIKHGEDGAVVVFEGIVRNHTRNRQTIFADYEAYEPMARGQLSALAEKVRANSKVREVVIVHRLGRLETGETSVLIAVASAHRAAAFDACRFAIDALKRTVPIWKKEHFTNGVVWADGEPFPEELQIDREPPKERP